jgi:hypothetical protein
VARRVGGANVNGHNMISWPGAYQHVLQEVCRERAGDHFAALTDCDMAEVERENAAAVAACMRERAGEPVFALSYHLPSGMPALFQPFPVRSITVMPDDRVILRPRTARTSRRG